jgi:hypothetical protein
MTQKHPDIPEDRPPVFRTWNQVYVFLLVFQAVLLALFYWFMRAFS